MIGIPSRMHMKDIQGESDSAAGLVLEISGKFPAVNREPPRDLETI